VVVGLAMVLVQGCATVPHEGRTGLSLPDSASSPSEATLVSTDWSTFSSEAMAAALNDVRALVAS
jgi:hypothetical protein